MIQFPPLSSPQVFCGVPSLENCESVLSVQSSCSHSCFFHIIKLVILLNFAYKHSLTRYTLLLRTKMHNNSIKIQAHIRLYAHLVSMGSSEKRLHRSEDLSLSFSLSLSTETAQEYFEPEICIFKDIVSMFLNLVPFVQYCLCLFVSSCFVIVWLVGWLVYVCACACVCVCVFNPCIYLHAR